MSATLANAAATQAAATPALHGTATASPIEPHRAAGAGPAALQSGAALVALSSATDGSSRMTVQLMPRDLGKVEVAIIRDADGTAHVSVTADQPGTLRSLMSDADHLHGLLDQAGVPSEGRSLHFDLTLPPMADAGPGGSGGQSGSGDQPAPPPVPTTDTQGFDLANGGGGDDGSSQARTWQMRMASPAGHGTDVADLPPGAGAAPRTSWRSTGLNITA